MIFIEIWQGVFEKYHGQGPIHNIWIELLYLTCISVYASGQTRKKWRSIRDTIWSTDKGLRSKRAWEENEKQTLCFSVRGKLFISWFIRVDFEANFVNQIWLWIESQVKSYFTPFIRGTKTSETKGRTASFGLYSAKWRKRNFTRSKPEAPRPDWKIS